MKHYNNFFALVIYTKKFCVHLSVYDITRNKMLKMIFFYRKQNVEVLNSIIIMIYTNMHDDICSRYMYKS